MNLIKSTGTFSFFTLISRVLGYIRDILIAIFLGTGPLADAFFVAFVHPHCTIDQYHSFPIIFIIYHIYGAYLGKVMFTSPAQRAGAGL